MQRSGRSQDARAQGWSTLKREGACNTPPVAKIREPGTADVSAGLRGRTKIQEKELGLEFQAFVMLWQEGGGVRKT